MVDPALAAALALLVAGVAASVVPLVPGAALSLSGVYLHWWATGYAAPGLRLLAALTLVGVVTVLADLLAGSDDGTSAASLVTTVLAVAVGGAVFTVTGPLGLVLSAGATVFAVEYLRHRDARKGARATARAGIGLIGSTVPQVVLTGAMLVAMVWAVWL